MTPFTIFANPPLLTRNIQGFYHTDFGGVELPNNPNYLYKLKNDPHHNWTDQRIQEAQQQLLRVLLNDLPNVLNQVGIRPLTVCDYSGETAPPFRRKQRHFSERIYWSKLNDFLILFLA